MLKRVYKKKIYAYDVYVVLSLIFIIFFFLSSILYPHSQNTAVFGAGFDFLADYVNNVKYTFSQSIYTAEGAPIIPDAGILSSPGDRTERLYPPLAYLLLHLPKSMTAMEYQFAPMFFVTALWSVAGWTALLLLICFVQIYGETWKKFLFCFVSFFSGVMLFAMERGTLVLLSSSLTAFFIFNYKRKEPWLREMAFVALAIAAGLKLSPAILGLLLLSERRWREAIRLSIYGAAAIFLPFLYLPGGFSNLRYLIENIVTNGDTYLHSGIHVGVGYLGKLIYVLYANLSGGEVSGIPINALSHSICAAISVLGIILAFTDNELWRKNFLALLPILFVPKNSGFYNLLYLLPIIVLLCNEREPLTSRKALVVSLFALLLMPYQLFPHQIQLFSVLLLDSLVILAIVGSSRCFFQTIRMEKSLIAYRK